MIVVLRNDAEVPPGYLADALTRSKFAWRMVRLDEGDALPPIDGVQGVVALGGLMGAYDTAAYPHLVEEKRFFVRCVDADIPLLGICLGAQLLADALGGRVYLADRPEAVLAPIELTEAGAADPVVQTVARRRVLRIHQDTWDPPPQATALASGGGFEQAFRLGSALGIQPHLEVDPEIVANWLALDGGRELSERAGTDPDDLMWAVAGARIEAEETAAAFFDAWAVQC